MKNKEEAIDAFIKYRKVLKYRTPDPEPEPEPPIFSKLKPEKEEANPFFEPLTLSSTTSSSYPFLEPTTPARKTPLTAPLISNSRAK